MDVFYKCWFVWGLLNSPLAWLAYEAYIFVDNVVRTKYKVRTNNKKGLYMQSVITKIMNELSPMFAPMDAEVLVKSQEWAKERCAALKAWKALDTTRTLRKEGGEWAYYMQAYAIAGGKTWFATFNYSSEKGVEDFVAKNCKATAEKRNATIARKLEKASVTEVLSSEYTRTNDGFDGVFSVMTNTGKRTVIINTIYAGGYNVQCLHLRVLTKIS